MANAHYVTCDTTIDGKPIKGLKVEVITNFTSKPTTIDVQKALQALHPGKKIGGIFGLKA